MVDAVVLQICLIFNYFQQYYSIICISSLFLYVLWCIFVTIFVCFLCVQLDPPDSQILYLKGASVSFLFEHSWALSRGKALHAIFKFILFKHEMFFSNRLRTTSQTLVKLIEQTMQILSFSTINCRVCTMKSFINNIYFLVHFIFTYQIIYLFNIIYLEPEEI